MRRAAITFGICLIVSGVASAQEQRTFGGLSRSNSIMVKVGSRSGAPIKDLVRIELFQGGIPSLEEYANIRGERNFNGLEDGSYTVRASAPNYRPESRDVELNSNATRRVTLFLAPMSGVDPLAAPPSDPTVSVRWLAAPLEAREEVVKAREQREQGNLKGAAKRLRKVAESNPTFSIALNELGMIYHELENAGEAQKMFDRSIAVDGEYLPPYLNLAEILAEDKRYNEAGQLLSRASQAVPDRGEPFYQIARIQYDTGHVDRAEQACRMALERDSSRIPEIHLLLVNIYSRKKEPEKVIAELEAYLDKAPEGVFAEPVRKRLEKAQGGQ